MDDAGSTEAAATPTGKPLSMRQAKGIVIAMAAFVLFVAALGIHNILVGEKLFAFLCCFVATFWLLSLLIYVYIYLQVKKGKHIVLNFGFFQRVFPGFFQRPSQVPLVVSAFFAGLLTLLVVAANYMSFAILYPVFRTMPQHLVICGINLFLWLVVAFAWYRLVITESRKPRSAKAVSEQMEGVWPPAPRSPDDDL